MLRAGVEGLRDGASEAGRPEPHALAVTVLTSDADTGPFDARLDVAVAAGCDGVVCSAHEVARVQGARDELRDDGSRHPAARRSTRRPGARCDAGRGDRARRRLARGRTHGDGHRRSRSVGRGGRPDCRRRACATPDDALSEGANWQVARECALPILTPVVTGGRPRCRSRPRSLPSSARPRSRRPPCAPQAGRGEGEAEGGLAQPQGAVRPGRPRRDPRQAQGRERARVAPRRRQGARPPPHGGARHQREPPSARSRHATSATLLPRARSPAEPTLGILLVVAGPSGAGKGTIVRRLLEGDPSLWYSVSATTRAPRAGRGRRASTTTSSPGRSSSASATPAASSSGSRSTATSRARPRARVDDRLARGGDVVLEIDVQGALAVREQFPDALLVFVRPPSREEQRRRLLERGQRRRRHHRAAPGAGRGRGGPRRPLRRGGGERRRGPGRGGGRCYPGNPAERLTSPEARPPQPQAPPARRHTDSGDTRGTSPHGRTTRLAHGAPHGEPARPGGLQVHAGHAGGHAGPRDQRLLQPARRGSRQDRPARRSPRCRASRSRSPSRRSRSARSSPSRSRRSRRPARRARKARRPPKPRRAGRRHARGPGRGLRPRSTRPGRHGRWAIRSCAARSARRARRRRRDRRVQGGRGLPAARRRGRARRPRPHRRRNPLRRRRHLLGARVRARATSLFDGPDPIPHTRLGQQRRSRRRRARDGQAARQVRRRDLRRPADRHAARDPCAGRSSRRPCTPRCGSTPPCRTTWPPCAARGVHVVDPEEGRLAGGDVGAGRLADPATIVAAIAEVLGVVGRPRRDLAARDRGRHPRADRPGPLRRATARRGRWATPSPRPPPAAAPPSPSSPRWGGPRVRAASSSCRSRPPRTWRTRCCRGSPSATSWSWPRPWPTSGPRQSPTRSSRSTTACPRSCSSPRPTSSRRWGSASSRARCWSGFAAETERLREHAAAKLAAKRVDLMVANDVSAPDAGFEVDTNRAVLLDSSGSAEETPLLEKRELAGIILDRIVRLLGKEA